MSKKGFTLIELLISVTLIGILSTMALPNFYRIRLTTRKTICLNNLRQIEAATDRWVFENDVADGTIATADGETEIYSYIRGGRPPCPSDGEYTIGVTGTYPQVTCNIQGHTLAGE